MNIKLSLLFCLFLFSQLAFSQLYTFKQYDHKDGLAIAKVNSFLQSKEGYLFLGTDGGGLIKFNGNTFTETEPNSIQGSFHILDMCELNSKIYFVSKFNGVYCYDGKKTKLVFEKAQAGDYRRIDVINGKLVVLTSECVFLIDTKGKVIWRKKNPKKYNSCKQKVKCPNGVLFFFDSHSVFIHEKGISPIRQWNSKIPAGFKPDFANFEKGILKIYSIESNEKITVLYTKNGNFISGKPQKLKFDLSVLKDSFKFHSSGNKCYATVTGSQIFIISDTQIKRVVQNSNLNSQFEFDALYVDNHEDLWAGNFTGTYRISIEPFTKIDLNPVYSDRAIYFIDRLDDGTAFIGNYFNYFHIGKVGKNNSLTKHNYRIYASAKTSFGYFLASNKGVLKYNGSSVDEFALPEVNQQSIEFIFWDGTYLWYYVLGNGLFKYSFETKQVVSFKNEIYKFPGYFYTAQISKKSQKIYFGTNSGIYTFDSKKKSIKKIKYFLPLGDYCGNSVTDSHGTLWFTLEKGLAGITQSGNFVTITNINVLKSTLFYTLSADLFGNVLIGTNKGITVIKVSPEGELIKHQIYNNKNGFGGFETNMRASFQDNSFNYVATVEGLYQINSTLLEKTIVPDNLIIIPGRESKTGEFLDVNGQKYFTVKCLLSKNSLIKYSYRLKEHSEKWSTFSENSEIIIPKDLPSGKYKLQVRGSFDCVHFSKICEKTVSVKQIFWRSKWFLIFLVLLIAIVNVFYLEWNKTRSAEKVLNSRDFSIGYNLLPNILFFGLFAELFVGVIVYFIDPWPFDSTILNSCFVFFQLITFFISKQLLSKQNSNKILLNFFVVCVFAIIFKYYLLAYFTNLHAFSLIGIIFVAGLLPFLFNKIQRIIIIGMVQILAAGILIGIVEKPVYNPLLFLISLGISIVLNILFTILRNESVQKLTFIDSVVNQSNLLAISFNKAGIINYCSNNISEVFNIDSSFLMGKPIGVLNTYVATEEMREYSLLSEFKDGQILQVPFFDRAEKILWYEFTCKEFNEENLVILGSEITEKLTLSTNYQSLVENADDLIYNTDVNGDFQFLNEKAIRTFGFKAENLIGKNSIQLVHPDFRDSVLSFYNNQFESNIHNTYLEFPIRTRDGKIIWLGQNVTMTFVLGTRKVVAGFVALARDISEKRENDILLAIQNKGIKENIESARKIQYNLLPTNVDFLNLFPHSFVFFKPKEIVSGDFYNAFQIGSKKYLVLGDCSGHGVSGAFYSILGLNILNMVLFERNIREPHEILEHLLTEFYKNIPVNRSESRREMIVSVACFDDNLLSIASNGGAVIVVQKEGSTKLRNTALKSDEQMFQSQNIVLEHGSLVYFLTDGYQNQIGGIKEKKFSFKRMEELMTKINQESLPLQKKHFENALRNWSEGHEQNDDISVICIKYFSEKT